MSRVKVCVRCRPTENGIPQEINISSNTIAVNASNTPSEFLFDDVLNDSSSQELVFRKCVTPIIDKALDGFNGCIFAYGQTGAGKTHTMTGPIIQTFEDRGVCMRTAGYLFEKARRRVAANPESNIVIRMSAIEIYNETLIDLFHKSVSNQAVHANTIPAKLVIVDLPGGVTVPALFLIPVDNEDDAYNLLLETFQNRIEAEHQLNRRSSRSHVIYTYYLTMTNQSSLSNKKSNKKVSSSATDIIQSKIHLVDLAGSERIEKTGSTGMVQKEASHINKSYI